MMGPAKGTPEYDEQIDAVLGMFRLLNPSTPERENEVLAMFAWDASFSRDAIMTAFGRWRSLERQTKQTRSDRRGADAAGAPT